MNVKSYVEKKIKELSDEKTASQEDMPSFDLQLSLYTWLIFEECTNCAQQSPNSQDCAYFVCNAMQALVERRNVASHLKDDELTRFKATLATRFVQDFNEANLDRS